MRLFRRGQEDILSTSRQADPVGSTRYPPSLHAQHPPYQSPKRRFSKEFLVFSNAKTSNSSNAHSTISRLENSSPSSRLVSSNTSRHLWRHLTNKSALTARSTKSSSSLWVSVRVPARRGQRRQRRPRSQNRSRMALKMRAASRRGHEGAGSRIGISLI